MDIDFKDRLIPWTKMEPEQKLFAIKLFGEKAPKTCSYDPKTNKIIYGHLESEDQLSNDTGGTVGFVVKTNAEKTMKDLLYRGWTESSLDELLKAE